MLIKINIYFFFFKTLINIKNHDIYKCLDLIIFEQNYKSETFNKTDPDK